MPSCCYGDEYGSVFTRREAARTAARFRRRGLRGSARELIEVLGSRGPTGMTLLEVGGGSGVLQVALLEAGIASRATNVELSGSWEEAARALLEERGLSDRVERVVGDFVDEADRLPAADLVLLQAVVCCYPDWRAMLRAAQAKTARILALTFPADRWWNRAVIRVGNLWWAMRRRSFRAYVHPPEAMLALLRSAGLEVVHDREGRVWRTVVAERATG